MLLISILWLILITPYTSSLSKTTTSFSPTLTGASGMPYGTQRSPGDREERRGLTGSDGPLGALHRVMVFTILWSLLLSLNNLIGAINPDIDVMMGAGIEMGSYNLYNNLIQWSWNASIIEIFTYILFIILLIAPKNYQNKILEKELSLIGILLLLFVNDYISFYVTLECQSLILYILASRDSISSGLKYFVVGSLSSALILLGIVIIYTHSGITEISVINGSWSDVKEIIWGKGLIILGILIKLGVPPFHQWNIEILSNTKTDLTIFFSTISKISLLFILRLLTEGLSPNFSIFVVLCLIVGSFMGLIQNQVKRLLAYSGVVHLGFFLLSLMATDVGFPSAPGEGISLAFLNLPPILFYLFQYFISLVIILIITDSGGQTVHGFKLGGSSNFLMIILIMHLLSLSGFPPFLGFVGKWVVLQITIGTYFLICLIAMLASVISFFIYFNWIQLLPSAQPGEEELPLTSTHQPIPGWGSFNAWVISFLTWSSFTMLVSCMASF